MFQILALNGKKKQDDSEVVRNRFRKLVKSLKKGGINRKSKIAFDREKGIIYRCYELYFKPPIVGRTNYWQVSVKYAGEFYSSYLGVIYYYPETQTFQYYADDNYITSENDRDFWLWI